MLTAFSDSGRRICLVAASNDLSLYRASGNRDHVWYLSRLVPYVSAGVGPHSAAGRRPRQEGHRQRASNHRRRDLGSIRRSLGLAILDNYASIVLQIAATIVLARLLTPQDFGTFAVAAVLSTMAGSVRHFGVPEFLLQEKQLDSALLRTAFGVSLVASASLGVLLYLLAPLVQKFYAAGDVASVLRILSIGYFLTPFAVVTTACFRRELRMAPLLAANLCGSVVSFVVGVGLASHGHGPASLAWSVTAGMAASVAVALVMKPPAIPVWPSLRGAGRILRFGRHASGVYLFGQAGTTLPDAIIGKVESVTAVAYFSRASGLVELFNRLLLQSVMPVVGPAFAQSARAQGEVRTVYLASTAHLTAVAWPLLLLTGLLSYPAIRLMYGPQWIESVTPVQVMCLGAVVSVTWHLTKDALLALGQAKACSQLQLKVHALRLAGLVAALPYGLEAACWGLIAGTVLGAGVTQHALGRATGLSFRAVVQATSLSFWVALITTLPALVLVLSIPPREDNFLAVGLGAAAMAVVAWCLAIWQLSHPLWREVVHVVRDATRRG